MATPRFTPRTLTFLRALQRHNDRDWFRDHRDEYESDVRAPMVEVVERLAIDLPRFARDLVAVPRTSIYRIHRDTRFTEDKTPYKTHVAAIFPCRDLGKHEGAGLYLDVAPSRVLVAGGLYAPRTEQLHAVRERIAANLARFRRIVEASGFRRSLGAIEGDRLQRVPRGFPPAHPAADYLRLRQYLVSRTHPPSFATSPRFYSSVLATFKLIAPFIHFINEPLLALARSTGSAR